MRSHRVIDRAAWTSAGNVVSCDGSFGAVPYLRWCDAYSLRLIIEGVCLRPDNVLRQPANSGSSSASLMHESCAVLL